MDFRAVCLVRAMTELGSEDLGSKYPLYDQCVTMRKIGYKANKNRHKGVMEAYKCLYRREGGSSYGTSPYMLDEQACDYKVKIINPSVAVS